MIFKNIFIGSITRSGGSLLARLFDGHKRILSYPLELPFPHDNAFYEISDNFSGIPMSVPVYSGNILDEKSKYLYPGNLSRSLTPSFFNYKANSFDKYDLLNIPKETPKVEIEWGKEKSDILGVRKNYLEKSYYEKVETEFDFENYMSLIKKYSNEKSSWLETCNARHLAFFKSWDKGKCISKNTSHVVSHDSGGLYLTNINDYFKFYEDSRFIVPVRDILGFVASEKIRLARIYFGSRRFNKPILPFFLVKKFKDYDLRANIRKWTTSITRIYLLQKEFGVNKNFIAYSTENLVNNTRHVMKSFTDNLKIEFDEIVCKPTIGRRPWGGNSHYGRFRGINKKFHENYKIVLDDEEVKFIKDHVGSLREDILSQKSSFLDTTIINKENFRDLHYQEKYFYDREKISLYYSLVNYGGRKTNVKKVNKLSIFAVLFSIYAYIYNIPRLIKLKYFPGVGKQNYT